MPIAIEAAPVRPTDVDDTFTVEGFCAFSILFEVSGKTKVIELPGGRILITSPGLTVTLTNLENENQETFGVTGAYHQTILANGTVVTVSTGRSLFLDPFGQGAGLGLFIGRWTFAFDAEGNFTPVVGTGRQIDVCELLA
jgi:hypothetical protein